MSKNDLRELAQLRQAAQQREWNTLQDTLKQLFTQIEPLSALGIAITRAQAFWPTFAAYYPDAGWVRELLDLIIATTAPNQLPLEALTEFPEPGCGNFLMAVFDLARAVDPQFTLAECYGHITSAVANAILADLQHTYYNQHRDEYSLLFDPGAAAQVQQSFWLDRTVANRDTAIWLEIADAVEAILPG